MPLTPEDVHEKTFTPVRLREGYDMGEVDQFLDEVEAELIRLRQENEELRAELERAGGSTPSGKVAPSGPATQAPAAAETAKPAPAMAPVQTIPQAATAAARLLEIATNNADQLVNEAKEDADKIIGEAHAKAERLETESKAKADRLDSDARTRAEKLDSETTERRNQLLGQLESDKESVARELEDLRTFEREYRARLKGYFQAQLQALDGEGDGNVPLTPSQDGDTPRRLRELLGEDI
jgi:DivIVA domain-containing protein